MLFVDVVTDFLQHVQFGLNLTQNTVRVYRSWLGVFNRWADNVFSPLRAIAAFCRENDLITDDPCATIKMPKKEAPSRPLASDQELAALLAATERQADLRRVARDRAMLSVLIYCGVRFQELLDIRVQDVSLDSKTLLVASGKERKSRLLYPNTACLTALSEWLLERAKMKVDYDWLWAFDTRRRMGEPGTRQMFEDTKARSDMADHKNLMPHAIRRAYATRCLAKGIDLHSLSASLGHASPSTTLIYTYASDLPAKAMRHYADLRIDSVDNAPQRSSPADSTSRRRADQSAPNKSRRRLRSSSTTR